MPRPDRATALVVAYEDQLRTKAADALHDHGFDVLAARRGRQAVEAVRCEGGIDLLVAEMDLPDLDGITLAQLARRHRPDLKVLLISPKAEALRLAERFDVYGVAEPVRAEVLAAVARSIVAAPAPQAEPCETAAPPPRLRAVAR